VTDAFPHVPLLDLLGIRPTGWGEGTGEIEMTVDDRHLRTLGILHGGVTATLLDSVMGLAAGTLAPENRLVVTAQLNMNFIRPAWEGETLVARGRVRHHGRQTAVSEGDVRTSDDELVATGSATFLFVDAIERERGAS